MRIHLSIICSALLVGGLTPSCFATPTNIIASVKTNYVSNGILTADELDTVVKLAKFCVVQLPSAYRFQAKFNERSRKAREMEIARPTPETSLEPTATAPSGSTNK
jgi:hypothetical protein